MTSKIKTFVFGLALLGFIGCEQERAFRSPLVFTEGVEIAEDGHLILKGSSAGGTNSYADSRGFCYDFNGAPGLDTYQIFANGEGKGAFECRYPYTQIGDTLYFRALAASEIGGVSLGEMQSIILPEHPAPQVPCSILSNTMEWNQPFGGTTNTYSIGADTSMSYANWGKAGMRIGNFNGPISLFLDFSSEIRQGKFLTVSQTKLSGYEGRERLVYAYVHDGFNTYPINTAQDLFITHLEDGTRRIECCDLNFDMQGGLSAISVSATF